MTRLIERIAMMRGGSYCKELKLEIPTYEPRISPRVFIVGRFIGEVSDARPQRREIKSHISTPATAIPKRQNGTPTPYEDDVVPPFYQDHFVETVSCLIYMKSKHTRFNGNHISWLHRRSNTIT